MSFGKFRPRREAGLSFFDNYRWSWFGAPWHALLKGKTFNLATVDGTAKQAAEDFPNISAIFELAIAHTSKAGMRIAVYLGATDNLRETMVSLMTDGGHLRGFLDYALRNNHMVWMRYKRKPGLEAANKARDDVLADFDFAWIQQPGARGRSLVLKPTYGCCGCLCKSNGLMLAEGPAKFMPEKPENLRKNKLYQMLHIVD